MPSAAAALTYEVRTDDPIRQKHNRAIGRMCYQTARRGK